MAQPLAAQDTSVAASPTLKESLIRAGDYAARQGLPEVSLEHLLLALTDDADAAGVLKASAIDMARLRDDLATSLASAATTPGTELADEPRLSVEVRRILEYAGAAARQSGRGGVDGAIVLAAIIGEGKSMAASFLRSQGLTFQTAIKAIQQALAERTRRAPAMAVVPAPATEVEGTRSAGRSAKVAPGAATVAPAPSTGDALSHPGAQPATAQASANDALTERTPGPLRPVGVEPPNPVLRTSEPAAAASAVGAGPPPLPPVRPRPTEAAGGGNASALAAAPAAAAVADAASDGGRRQAGGQSQPDIAAATPLAFPEPRSPSVAPLERVAAVAPPPPRVPAAPPLPPPAAPPAPVAEAKVGALRAPLVADIRPLIAPWPETVEHRLPAEPPPYLAPGAAPTGLPYPEPELIPQPSENRAPGHLARPVSRPVRPPPAAVIGHIVDNVPRRMRVGRVEVVEVRIDRPERVRQDAGTGGAHTLVAVTVRLLAVRGSVQITPLAPETQWSSPHADRLASEISVWRFAVTPDEPGPAELSLAIATRTIGTDLAFTDESLPERLFPVRVDRNLGRGALRALWLVAVAALGATGGYVAAKVWPVVALLLTG